MTREELSAREGEIPVPNAVSTARLEELEAVWTLRTSARTGNRWVQLWQLACAWSRRVKQPLAA